jgi:hypothetical protein
MSNIYYVYNDETNEWVGDNGHMVPTWMDAQEFHTEEEAVNYADKHDYVVFGWYLLPLQ